MNFHDWLLALHVLAAFTAVAALVVFGGILLAERAGAPAGARLPARRLSRLGEVLWNVGGGTVLLFGIWLAIEMDEYQLWDPWILAAFVLWAVAGYAGTRVARGLGAGPAAGSTAGGAAAGAGGVGVLYAVMAIALLALLLDMIYKPGA
jgi:hypothetical protein